MLNLFAIQWLALFAYAILRVTVGAVLIILGIRHLRLRQEIALVTNAPLFPFPKIAVALLILAELVAGALITLGAYTQLGALILISLAVKMLLWRDRFAHPSIPSRLMYLLLLGCGLSLFITGAGVLAIDLPI
ncbi:DoxX family membrane protein [Patescibacteria group bacterium]|nr:DoxX family membrane protein [Patescibacteria group bacterium]